MIRKNSEVYKSFVNRYPNLLLDMNSSLEFVDMTTQITYDAYASGYRNGYNAKSSEVSFMIENYEARIEKYQRSEDW